jgi:hypothetical protein
MAASTDLPPALTPVEKFCLPRRLLPAISDFFSSRQENLSLRGVPNASRQDEQRYPLH